MIRKATILTMLFALGMFSSCSVEDNFVDTPTAPGDELREKLQTLDWGSALVTSMGTRRLMWMPSLRHWRMPV